MARNTSRSYLVHKGTGSAYSILVDVKEIPATGQAPNMLDSTTLSDDAHTYIPDIADTGGGLEFTCNYTPENVAALEAVAGKEEDYGIWFGATETTSQGVTTVTPDGSEGKWNFKGILSLWSDALSVGNVHDLKFSIAPTTPVEHVS